MTGAKTGGAPPVPLPHAVAVADMAPPVRHRTVAVAEVAPVTAPRYGRVRYGTVRYGAVRYVLAGYGIRLRIGYRLFYKTDIYRDNIGIDIIGYAF